jgi:hypothetical protein
MQNDGLRYVHNHIICHGRRLVQREAPVSGAETGWPASMTDTEVLSVALAGQWRQGVPWTSERAVVRYMQQHGRHWFPRMLSRSTFNQRVRNLWGVLLRLQQDLSHPNSQTAAYEIVDTVPVPVGSLAQAKAQRSHWMTSADVGYGGTQGQMYWGHQALMSVRVDGCITGWVLASASTDDRWLMQGFVSQRAGQVHLYAPTPWRTQRRLSLPGFVGAFQACGPSACPVYLADKGFNGVRWQRQWASQYAVQVLTAPSRGTACLWSRAWSRWFKPLRQPIETVFALLSDVFALKRLHAHSLWGLYTRLALVTAAHNMAICLNQRLGRALWSHATLIC